MARQRILAVPVLVDIDGVKSSYDIVRITRIALEIGQIFDKQSMLVEWAVGSVSPDPDGVPLFTAAPFSGLQGGKRYNNSPPDYVFGVFLAKVLPLGIGPFLDQIFADLEADGVIKAGTQEDFGLAPGS
jgi:hypothetical protein